MSPEATGSVSETYGRIGLGIKGLGLGLVSDGLMNASASVLVSVSDS